MGGRVRVASSEDRHFFPLHLSYYGVPYAAGHTHKPTLERGSVSDHGWSVVSQSPCSNGSIEPGYIFFLLLLLLLLLLVVFCVLLDRRCLPSAVLPEAPGISSEASRWMRERGHPR